MSSPRAAHRRAADGRRGPFLASNNWASDIVPAGFTTTWIDADTNHLWSDANNWSNGLPIATKVAILSGSGTPSSNDYVSFDGDVLDANRVVLGLQTINDYHGVCKW